MKKFFQQKYILTVIAFAVLSLTLINISLPKIKEYNSTVYKEQNRLQIEADGVGSRKISFEIYGDTPRFDNLFTLVLIGLFLTLFLTKRIILSSLFASLLFVQILIFVIGIFPLINNYYLFTSHFFEFFFLLGLFAFSFWQAFAICRLARKKFQVKIFLK